VCDVGTLSRKVMTQRSHTAGRIGMAPRVCGGQWLYNNNSSCYDVVFDRGGEGGGGADDDVVDDCKCCSRGLFFSSIAIWIFFKSS